MRNPRPVGEGVRFPWENIPTIRGSRISLRLPGEADLNRLYSIYSDPAVMRYWGDLPMKDPREVKQLLAEIKEDLRGKKCIQWGIARQTDDQLIGTFALFGLDSVARKCEIGFALGRVYWGSGYMHEALQIAFGFLFNELDLRRIEADVDPRNASAIRLLEHLGFKREGYLRERWIVPGETQDSLFYGLLKREWNDTGIKDQILKGVSSSSASERGQKHLSLWTWSLWSLLTSRIAASLRRPPTKP